MTEAKKDFVIIEINCLSKKALAGLTEIIFSVEATDRRTDMCHDRCQENAFETGPIKTTLPRKTVKSGLLYFEYIC